MAKANLTAAQRAIPYNVQAEINAQNTINSYEKGLAEAEKILKERF